MTRTYALFLALVVVAGCRDAAEPFRPDDRPPASGRPLRLTYSSGDDRSPAWSAGSDTVYYSASSSDDVASDGALMALQREASVAIPLLDAQLGRAIPRRLVEPAPAPDSDDIAFIELRPLAPATACSADSVSCMSSELPSVALREAWLQVADSSSDESWPTIATLRFSGGAQRTTERIDNFVVFETRYTPAQRNWLEQRALPFKPSWSPDRTRLLTADDEGIQLVDIATGERTVVATGDVANPAWSPDGAWIAFDRVVRTDSITDLCLLSFEGNATCYERRVFYETTPPVVVLVRPDGSEPTELGPGSDPAWDPTGSLLYFVTADGIVRRDMDSGALEPIAGTEQGREPVVSPDGRWLVFTRLDEATAGHDVWVLPLDD
jgi:Tol biopolymer transport system component